ncbi:MAG: hypothetical protein M1821_007581 [Bathelium mastoideum]|nr:MAG: hypothetical protein M1821_007581 [Bathelium mastoideum]KAI9675478.1 MAG: hypothetical protein M1822_008956 [Bathelium mastoideum]
MKIKLEAEYAPFPFKEKPPLYDLYNRTEIIDLNIEPGLFAAIAQAVEMNTGSSDRSASAESSELSRVPGNNESEETKLKKMNLLPNHFKDKCHLYVFCTRIQHLVEFLDGSSAENFESFIDPSPPLLDLHSQAITRVKKRLSRNSTKCWMRARKT